jgi:hypothetical protein
LEPFGSAIPADPAATERGSRKSAAIAIFEIILVTIMILVLASADNSSEVSNNESLEHE